MGFCLCNGTPLPSRGVFGFFIILTFFHLYFSLSLFSLIFLSYHCFTYIFLITILLELIFLHISAFSWLFLISLCFSFHIFSSVLFFVLLSCPLNKNSPRTWSISSILGLCKDLLSIRPSSHLGQCSMMCSSVSLSSLHPTHISLFLCQEFSPRFKLFVLALNHTIDSRLPLQSSSLISFLNLLYTSLRSSSPVLLSILPPLPLLSFLWFL